MPSLTHKLGCLGCTVLLVIASICTWRFGPWYETEYDTSSLTATNSCENCCNGLESNCDLPVNQVLFPAVHNAHSSYENGFVAANNNLPLEEALVAGYRGLMLGSCMCEGFLGGYLLGENGGVNLGFCHSSCSAGVRASTEVLNNVKTFLETNPNEVLIIEIEVGDNSFDSLRQALNTTGISDYVYRPTDIYIQNWPTLRSLIDANTRILLFAHGDGVKSCKANDCPDGILYKFDHFSQTEEGKVESCDPALSGDVLSGYLLMNHWKTNEVKLPSEKNARELNSLESLKGRFEGCANRKRGPSILAVDFWDVGDVLDFVEGENLKRGGVEDNSEEESTSTTDTDDLSTVTNETDVSISQDETNGTAIASEARSQGV